MRYLLQRLATVLALLLAVSLLTFAALSFLGDPLFNILGPIAGDADNPESAAKIAAAEAEYHLDKSFPERYVRWAWDFVRGDFGVQFSSDGQPPVSGLLKERLPRTVELALMAQIMALGIAIPWGVMSASRANGWFDKGGTGVAFGLVSLPNFALGLLLYFVFALKLDWMPDSYDPNDPFWGVTHSHRMVQLILPALTLGLPSAAGYQRLLRTDLITTLQDDFVLMARAKGVSKRKVLYGHALRPSMFSVVTVFGINAGALIGGALVVETFFRIPGVGLAIVEAILRDDFPVVLAFVMIIAIVFVILNFLVDIFYTLLDPRVRQ